MRLLALHLLGFKSFADKTELRFGPGITAIVGPNGSGKSNIVDAIRWVLGEQSTRALRSHRAPDLIFNGTAHRKPLGLAQVTLVLDNSDQTLPVEYTEVAITRRVFRSGEGEFLINGQPCRLRDIQERLLGTGLGKGGMAVVGQGEVDSILSAHPLDRRLLLEETAGTSRYQAQKREAMHKLGQAQADLERVRDLVGELSARARDLAAQAQAAARWRELNQQLRQYQAARMARDWLALSQRWQQAQRELEAAQHALAEAEKGLSAAEGETQTGRDELARAQQELAAARQALHEAEARRAQLAHGLELARVQRQAVAQRLASLAGDRARRMEAQEQAAAELERLAKELQEQRAALERLREQVAAQERELAAYDAQHHEVVARLEQARVDVLEVLQQLADARNEARRLENDLAGWQARKERLGAAAASLAQEQAAAARAREEAAAALARQAEELRRRQQEAQGRAADLAAVREQLAAGRRALDQARSRLQEVRAHRQALARLEETHAGYQPAVKAVLGAKPPLPGLQGTVAQLLAVPAQVEVAVQVALGAAAQYIVMADEKALQQAIDYLRQRRAGRATFLALETLRARSWPAEHADALTAPGVVGRAADLVECGPEGRIVAEHLLGRTLVVEVLPRALELARRLPGGVRLVTLSGELVVPGGPVTGGSAPAAGAGGLLARRRELRELAERESQAQAELAEQEGAVAALAARAEELEQQLAQVREAAQRAEVGLARQRQLVASLDSEVQRLAKTLALNREEQAEADQAMAEGAQRLEALQAALVSLEEREAQLRATLAELTEQSRREEASRRRRLDALGEARARLAAQEAAVRGLVREREQWQAQAEAAATELSRLAEAEAQLAAEGRRLEAEEIRLEQALPEADRAVSQGRAQLQQAEAAAAAAQAAVDARETRWREQAGAVAALKERVWSLEAECGRHRTALEALAARMEELGLTPDGAAAVAAQGVPSAQEVRRVQEELEALGAVHLGAAEELAQVEERLAFLQEQQADLERAAGVLEEAIARLDRVCEERFAATFQRVAAAFDDLFQRLFGGGRAQLSLVPPEGGVDVHVQLPGRRTQHLLALSGGERALTAIALLFAMLQVNPSPFYVLDEIDAALDEANLTRFQRMLKEAAETAQFIVVTHRATTMEAAGILYGVTAAHPGVSTLVSVDLEQAAATTA
ncbi:MAG: chromosome segregation protein SMC [Limnochordales bacterium]